MKKVVYGAIITYTMIFSIRLVTVDIPLNILEKFSLIGMFVDYTFSKSKEL